MGINAMTNSSPDQKTDHPPLGEIYGDTRQITRIFQWFIAFILIGLVAGMIVVASKNNIFSLIVLGISLLPILAAFYFVHRQQFELTAVFLAVVLITLITFLATRGLGIHQVSIIGYPAILIVASLVIRKRTTILLTLYNIACAAWLVFGEISGTYTPDALVRSVAGDFFQSLLFSY